MAKGLAINQTFYGRDKGLKASRFRTFRAKSVSARRRNPRPRRACSRSCVKDWSTGRKNGRMGQVKPPILCPVNPLVSIILPARNAGENIAAALDAIAQQDYTPYEVIIISDGSTDQTTRFAKDILIS